MKQTTIQILKLTDMEIYEILLNKEIFSLVEQNIVKFFSFFFHSFTSIKLLNDCGKCNVIVGISLSDIRIILMGIFLELKRE